MSLLRHESVEALVELRKTNQWVIRGIRACGEGGDHFGKKLIREHQEGIRQIDAELKRRGTTPCDPPQVKA